ncbi:MAG: hypothetical protein J0H69_15055 [Burkholderiales bacterium]|nr:hypothetical protein [Burkholderiales bacterium]
MLRGHVLLGACLGLACVAPAQVAQQPLLQPATVNDLPNLVLTIDDSASMGLRHLPDAASPEGAANAVFHPLDTAPAGEQAGADAALHVWTTRADDRWSARMRFHGHNRLYYDPGVRYRPWTRADGTTWPQADPRLARLDPLSETPAADLTGEMTWPAAVAWCRTSPGANGVVCVAAAGEPFAPATFYTWSGDPMAPGSAFTRVRIMDAAGFERPASRTDCTLRGGGAWCSQADEYRNFANWFVYHRTRLHAAIAATSEVLTRQESMLRLGYGRVGQVRATAIDGAAATTLVRGVRPWSGAYRAEAFDWLHRLRPAGDSALRRAMDDVGRYYERSLASDTGSPWSDAPWLGVASRHSPCRRSYHLLVSDGGWNGAPATTAAARGNVDGVDGVRIEHADGRSWRYRAGPPWRDAHPDTLADVALHYFARDLHPELPNALAPRFEGDAYWQAMVTLAVGFGSGGQLDPRHDLERITRGELAWPAPQAGLPATVDDLWHAAINGGGRYLDALDPLALSDALSQALHDVRPMSVSSAGIAWSGEARVRVYVPSYRTAAWSGELEAYEMTEAGRSREPLWRASERMPQPADRNIWTWHPSRREALAFTPGEVARATPPSWRGDASLIDYLRGDRTREAMGWRVRDGVIGDIVHSQPRVIAQADDLQFNFLPRGTPGRETYRAFVRDTAARAGLVFFGANDGMLHAVREHDGVEAFAFVPAGVHGLLPQLAQSSYGHRFFVDGPVAEAQAWWGGRWRSVVLASAGRGAASIAAIDVTDTSALGGHSVLWEYGRADDAQLGHVLSPPDTGMTRGGQWIAAFGNGYDSAAGEARLVVLDLQSGRPLRVLRADVAGGNGLGGVRLVRDANQVVVAAYAGDLRGRVWRFDLRATDPAEWRVDFDGQPFFEALDASGLPQPVTAAPEYIDHPLGGQMVLLGSGRLHETVDAMSTQVQSLYGIWDRAPASRAARAGERAGPAPALVRHALVPVDEASATNSTRRERLDASPVDWRLHRGWRIDLPRRLRDIHGARFESGLARFRVVAPAWPDPSGCGAVEPEALDLYLRPLSGAAPPTAQIDNGRDAPLDAPEVQVTGVMRVAAEAPARLWVDRRGRAQVLGSSGAAPAFEPAALRPARQWRQLLNVPR